MAESVSFLDLFCGIGGMSLGLASTGMRCVGGLDNWAEAQATYEHNHGGAKFLLGDITATTTPQILSTFETDAADVDLVVGGPPCQGFSTVGRRDTDDTRNELWIAFHRIVREIRPAYVLIENVEGLIVMEKGKIRDKIIETFGEIGYRMKCQLLHAADYGVPQIRKRTFFLGWLNGLVEPQFPKPLRTPHVTVADAIFDLPELGPGQTKTEYDKEPTTDYQRARRQCSTVVYNHESVKHPPELVKVLSFIPDGGNRKSIPKEFQPKSGFHNSYARLASWKPAIAVTSNMRKPSSARTTHPNQNRGLTVREGLRLQSFDDTFVVLGSRTNQYLQVGNAVGLEILKAFRANSSSDILSPGLVGDVCDDREPLDLVARCARSTTSSSRSCAGPPSWRPGPP
jgi:DNA (cytosine-5)-methyltransferase 1